MLPHIICSNWDSSNNTWKQCHLLCSPQREKAQWSNPGWPGWSRCFSDRALRCETGPGPRTLLYSLWGWPWIKTGKTHPSACMCCFFRWPKLAIFCTSSSPPWHTCVMSFNKRQKKKNLPKLLGQGENNGNIYKRSKQQDLQRTKINEVLKINNKHRTRTLSIHLSVFKAELTHQHTNTHLTIWKRVSQNNPYMALRDSVEEKEERSDERRAQQENSTHQRGHQ